MQPAACPRVSCARAHTQALSRLDALLEEQVLAPAVRHAEGLARASLRLNLGRLDPMFGRVWGQATSQDVDTTVERTVGASGQTSASL